MIKHVYLLSLKDRNKADDIAERILSMKEKIPYIADIEVGFDFKGDSNSADIIEICTFKNKEDFRAFGADPYHAELREYLKGISSGMKIDYKL